MARVSIFYDNVEKEQFFMVRGDERYARSTKVSLRQGRVITHDTTFDLVLYIDVLRDTGESSIVIYDNDNVCNSLNNNNELIPCIYTWTSSDTERTITINGLNYDIDHNFQVEYIGNKSCGRSLSNTLLINIPDTHLTTPSLTINSNTQYDPNAVTSITVKLNNTINKIWNEEQQISLYYDGTYLSTITTDENGEASYMLNTGSIGKHTITAEYAHTEHLNDKSISKDISVGYNLTIVDYPNPVVAYTSPEYNYTAKLQDWFGNNIKSQIIYLQSAPPSQTVTDIGNCTTDNNGLATITDTVSIFRFRTQINNINYYTETITVPMYYINGLTLTTPDLVLSKGNDVTLTAKIDPVYSNVPVAFTGAINAVVRTNSNGEAITTYTPDGKCVEDSVLGHTNTKRFYAKVGDISKQITRNDYLQYWSPTLIKNRAYSLKMGNILDLQSVFRIQSDTLYNYLQFNDIPKNSDYTIKIQGVTSTMDLLIGYAKDSINTDNLSWQIMSNIVYLRDDSKNPYTLDLIGNTVYKLNNSTITITRLDGNVTFDVLTNGNHITGDSYVNQNEYTPTLAFLLKNKGNIDFNSITIWED